MCGHSTGGRSGEAVRSARGRKWGDGDGVAPPPHPPRHSCLGDLAPILGGEVGRLRDSRQPLNSFSRKRRTTLPTSPPYLGERSELRQQVRVRGSSFHHLKRR